MNDVCAPELPAAGGFTTDESGKRWFGRGALTFGNASAVLEASRELPLPTAGEIDCSGLGPVDSASVAVLLAIKRRAVEEGLALVFTHIEGSLHTLTDLYGVEELLATTAPPQ